MRDHRRGRAARTGAGPHFTGRKDPAHQGLRKARPGQPGPRLPVWSWGHRNVQGLAWDSDGRLWATEFGQQDVDELNLIEPGKNYGWPRCEGDCDVPGMTNPKATWSPTSTASPSGLAIVDGSAWWLPWPEQALSRYPSTARPPVSRRHGSTGSWAVCAMWSPVPTGLMGDDEQHRRPR